MLTAQIMAGAKQGGAEVFFERLCIALHDAGDSVLPVIRRDPARATRLRAAGLHPNELRFGGPADLLTRLHLASLLRRAAPAVVVAWMGRAADAVPRGPWTLVGRLGGYYDLKRFRRCRHLIGNTRDIADWIIAQGWPAERVHHLPNFVPDLRGAAPADRAALGIPPGAKLVVALGRLHQAKGFDVLIRALALLPGVHAVIAGEGEQRAALTTLAQAQGVAGRLHLPGWRNDAGSLLAAADLFVSSARHEPLGNAVLEAWSAARPVVAAAAQGPAALIRPGQDGLLAPIEDPEALAAAVVALLTDKPRAARLAEAGRARYLAEFGEVSVVAQWRATLAAIAAQPDQP
jgi:glycosyltransferase involved in cell wall biosynthesis